MVNVSMFLQDTKRDTPEGIWVKHPEEDYSIKARPLYPWKNSELRQQAAKNGQDDDLFNQLLADWIVEDWKGIFDETGKKVPCNPENKILLFENWTSFNLFVKETGLRLERQRKETEEKN